MRPIAKEQVAKLRSLLERADSWEDGGGSWESGGYQTQALVDEIEAAREILTLLEEEQADAAPQSPLMSDNGFPRRIRSDDWLTDAVILLGRAKDRVADYVDRQLRQLKKEQP